MEVRQQRQTPHSEVTLVLYYLTLTMKKQWFSFKEILESQDDAKQFFDRAFPEHKAYAERQAILGFYVPEADSGFRIKAPLWEKVEGLSFNGKRRINSQLSKLYYKYLLIEEVDRNYYNVHSRLTTQVKRGGPRRILTRVNPERAGHDESYKRILCDYSLSESLLQELNSLLGAYAPHLIN